jgi:UDP-N-acetylmuramate dehydrogenase
MKGIFTEPQAISRESGDIETGPGDILGREGIFKRIRKRIKEKKGRQPLDTKNAGCFFKNPPDSEYGAGEMIDKCGLRGFRYGGAAISEKHARADH